MERTLNGWIEKEVMPNAKPKYSIAQKGEHRAVN